MKKIEENQHVHKHRYKSTYTLHTYAALTSFTSSHAYKMLVACTQKKEAIATTKKKETGTHRGDIEVEIIQHKKKSTKKYEQKAKKK